MIREHTESSNPCSESRALLECRDRRRPDISWRLESALATEELASSDLPSPFHPARALANPFVHAVQLDYRIAPSADASLALTASVSLAGADTPKLARAAARVGEVLRAGFASLRPTHEFAPVAVFDAPDVESHGTTWCLRPRGLRVASDRRRTAGFSFVDDQAVQEVLVAPLAGQRGSVAFLSHLTTSSPGVMSLSMRIERVVLADEEVAALDKALRALRRGAMVGQPTAHGSWLPTDDGALSESAQRVLESWLRRRLGYRLVCTLRSGGDARTLVDAGLLYRLYPGVETAVTRLGDGTAQWLSTAGDHAIDLRDCVTDIDQLPDWLPNRRVLVAAGVPRHYAEVDAVMPPDGIVLGRTASGEVRLAAGDRSRHLYLCGSTGTGKSTLLFNLALQEIEAGMGVCVIDPHGDLHDALLGSLPRHRLGDVVLVDPGHPEGAIGLNFLETRGPERRREVAFLVNEMIKIFESLYDMRAVGGPMFEQYMRNTLLLLMLTTEYEQATLLDVARVFEDPTFRRALLERCPDPLVRSFWRRQAEKAGGDAALNNMAPYVTSKLNLFVANPLVRPIIGQVKSTIDFRAIMDERRILLVNLSRGELGRFDSQLLGMLVMGRLLLAAFSRADVPADRRVPFSVYVDEFQNFTTDTVAQALSEARKFGLSLTLANQTLSQLEASANRVLEAVLGNCGSMVLFRLGVPDARRLEAYSGPQLTAADLQGLPDYHAVVRLLVSNHPQPPFVMKTEPRRAVLGAAGAEEVRAIAFGRHARRVADVEDEISRRWTSDPFAEPDRAENERSED